MSSARRLTGVGATVAALAIVLTGCFPPKPPPPPKFKLAAGLWRTAGTADGASECHFARIAADGSVITDVRSDHGARYVQTADTDSEFVTSGCQPWTQYDGTEQVGGSVFIPCVPYAECTDRRSFQDGDYIVGHDYNLVTGANDPTGDIPWGDVYLNVYAEHGNLSACHWQKVGDWTGTTLLASGDGNGDGMVFAPQVSQPLPGFVHLTEGQGMRITDCGGMWWAGL
jgi:hypothetical protein